MTALPLVRTRLPDESLDAFLARPWQPIINAFNHARTHPQAEGAFPLRWAALAPNSPAFLKALGKPLAIARDLESKPGVWWLSTADERYDFVIFSDCHRKNSWKGGQICMAKKSLVGFTPNHPGLVALCAGLQSVWGQPETFSELDIFEPDRWFDEKWKANPDIQWPRFPAPSSRLKP